MTMTTSKMREKARFYESQLDWANAAVCWRDAIALYPRPYPKLGELEQADIAKMEQRAKNCESMIDQQ